MNCSDFHKFENGVSLPLKIVADRIYHGPEESKTVESNTIQVRQYLVDGKANTVDKYMMVWPLGTQVFDTRSHESFIISSAPKTLDDDFISAAAANKQKKTQDRLNQLSQDRPATQP